MNPPRQERNFLSCFFLPEAAQRLTPRGPWGRAVNKNSAPRRCGERKALDLLALRVSHQLVPSLPVFSVGTGGASDSNGSAAVFVSDADRRGSPANI